MSQRSARPPAWSFAAVIVALAIFVALIGRCLGPISANQTPTPTRTAAPVATMREAPTRVAVAPTVREATTVSPTGPTMAPTSVPTETVPVTVTPMLGPPPAPAQLPRRP